MKIFLSPHPDDETLFGAYTILKEKPLVVMYKNTPERMAEAIEAMQVLGVNLVFVNDIYEIADLYVTKVYAPAIEGGHRLHDLLGVKALEIWKDKVTLYSTYRSPTDLLPRGKTKVEATEEMKVLKLKALQCYKSQIRATPVHFLQENKDEYYV
jgi:hypothetical protein